MPEGIGRVRSGMRTIARFTAALWFCHRMVTSDMRRVKRVLVTVVMT